MCKTLIIIDHTGYGSWCSNVLLELERISAVSVVLLLHVLGLLLAAALLGEECEHLLLHLGLLDLEAVLVPDEVRVRRVEVVPSQACLEQLDDVPVVRVLGEAEASAVVHELLEFVWLISAELLNAYLLLLFLNISVFFLLRSTGKSLPWKGPLEEIE